MKIAEALSLYTVFFSINSLKFTTLTLLYRFVPL